MSEPSGQLSAVLTAADRRIRVAVPSDVFVTAAEQLRFDAFRAGLIDASEWPEVQAHVTPSWLDKATPTESFAFVITLTGAGRPVRTLYHSGQLQRLKLYIEYSLGRMLTARADMTTLGEAPAVDVSTPANVALFWNGPAEGLHIPLGPLTPPTQAPTRAVQSGEPKLPGLRVSAEAGRQLGELAEDSQLRSVELGGCLIGYLPDADHVVVTRVARAPDVGGSSAHFEFHPRFWVGLANDGSNSEGRVVGWVHTHVVEHGHGPALSRQDLQTAHLHFSAPWSITALACATPDHPEMHWFYWKDGALVRSDDRLTLARPSATRARENGR